MSNESRTQLIKRIGNIFKGDNPTRFNYEDRMKMIFRTENKRASNMATFSGAKELQERGIKMYKYTILHPKDPCPTCRAIANQKPIPLDKPFVHGETKEQFPPMHPNSYDKDTEVYTERGWINIKDVKIGDKCLSLKEDLDVEWIEVTNTYKHFVDKMLHFKNVNFDLKVTKDHNMFYKKRWDERQNREVWQFCKAAELPPESRFYRSSKFKGRDIYNINLGDKTVDIYDYVQFMAWFLSEGCTVTNRKGRVIISQSKKVNLSLIHI